MTKMNTLTPEELVYIRKAKLRMNQREFGAMIGRDVRTISSWETGASKIPVWLRPSLISDLAGRPV